MLFGAVFPTTEIGNDQGAIRDYAQTAEALGCVRLTTYDHVLGADHADRDPPLLGPYTQHDPFHEPFVLLGFIAAYTRVIELATGVLVLPQRQTALVAKQAAEVDQLSGGRLVLGIGTGWNHVEYTALGTPFRNRARRFDEQISVLRALWVEELVDLTGEYHRIERASLVPRPERPIPLWLGGSADASLARSATIGDGHIFAGNSDRHFGAAARLAELLDERGRSHDSFGTDMFVDYAQGPNEWHARAERWETAGGTLMSMRSMTTGTEFLGIPGANLSGAAEHIRALERFMAEMTPQ